MLGPFVDIGGSSWPMKPLGNVDMLNISSIYFCLICAIRVLQAEQLDINELFPSFAVEPETWPGPVTPGPGPEPGLGPAGPGPGPAEPLPVAFRNFSLDIEKLDINKFKNKMLAEMKPKLRQSERALAAARRSMVSYYPKKDLMLYRTGYKSVINQQHCDMMLQLIYMAKAQVRIIENNPNVNTRDTGYRAGFIGHKCKRIFRKMARIVSFMKRSQYQLGTSSGHIVLHHRVVRLHVDFLYYYWILANLDAVYKQHLLRRPPLPPGDEDTAGISIEDLQPARPPKNVTTTLK